MKNIFLLLFVSIGLLTSCVENPEEDPEPLPPAGNLTVDFDAQTFQSTTTVTVIDAVSMSLKASKENGSYFKITLPENPLIGTYSWDVFDLGVTGFSLEYNEGIGTDSYVAARDDSGTFANFPSYIDTAQLVILAIDRTNKRVSGTFKFTGVRFTDDTQTVVETKEFTNGAFYNIPYTTTTVVDPIDNAVLPRRIVESYPGSGIADQESLFTYNGRKIISEVHTDSAGLEETTSYLYSGNLITKIEIIDDTELVERETFEYNTSNQLVTYVLVDFFDESGIKETYVHNADGSISVSRYTGDMTSQTELESTSTITFDNGEVSRIEFSSGQVKTYTYDTKNNAFKNVIGFDKIGFTNGQAQGNSKNVLQEISDSIPVYSFEYTYNTANYPLTAREIGITLSYFYE